MDTFLQILNRHSEAFLKGITVTVQLALIIWGSGIVIGTLLGILSAKYKRCIGIPTRIITFILSGIPVLVYLYWAHYPMQSILGVVINPFLTAAIVLSTINIFSVSEQIRTHLIDFPEQYRIAAKVCGLSQKTTVYRIQLPIILRQVIPSLLTQQVIMLHSTLFASLISVEEIFRVAQRVNSLEYKPIHIYTALALLFLIICLPVNGLAIWLRERFTRNLSET
ncbi:ABC transporter permease subunit [bacterium]|nr:ABC transporter permease subunit [bacterium]